MGTPDRLALLESMSPADLRAEWQVVYGTEAPRFPADLLRLAIGYRLQEKQRRGGVAGVYRELQRVARGAATAPSLRTGTQMMRSWNGRSIVVTVEADGYRFEGRCFRSLSAIARHVTGAHWSGPRFFGLTGTAERG